ncbi:MAG: phosphate acyltransferase PlsX [Clostridia bacterium]|nr:phosphate acyltransferase PlsX [Clostridia bacterium]
MKIIVDAFGGDNAPVEIVKGAVEAVKKLSDVELILTGDEQAIKNILKDEKYDGNRIQIVHAPDVISNDESPTMAIKQKKESSLVVGLDMLKNDESIVGMVSAGSTGAVLAGGLLRVGRIKGILRPALAPLLPNLKGGKTLLIDCGANMDCKPQYLEQFACLGSEYMRNMFGIESPRVAIISVGVEDKKGNAQVHETFELLKNNPNVNFVGNMEARDMLSGDFDVLVADGYVGNVALKATEGAFETIMSVLKSEIMASGLKGKIGGALLKNAFKRIKERMDYTSVGGSPFLGVQKILIKSHGSSKAKTIVAAIEQVKTIHEAGVVDKIKAYSASVLDQGE